MKKNISDQKRCFEKKFVMQSTNILCNSSLASNPIEFKLIAGDTKNVCVDDND